MLENHIFTLIWKEAADTRLPPLTAIDVVGVEPKPPVALFINFHKSVPFGQFILELNFKTKTIGGHQHGTQGHQEAPKDGIGSLQSCSKPSSPMTGHCDFLVGEVIIWKM